ncbi:glycoside hydrolase [Aureobasidium subglaciale]|nr:glycoside hydrolase [Aureobasidium subglaciale]
MLTHFYRLVTQINNSETTLDDAADLLSGLMTDDEHLALLQGNGSRTQYLSDNKASPYPASVVSRVGVPGLQYVDGSRQSFFTEFPSPLGRAASFNCQLEELIGEAIGIEVRAHGGNVYGGICLNVTRRSDWGRAHQSYGEDPFVISQMGSAAARGVHRNAMVAIRHFAMNSMEILREDGRIICDEKTMNELFLQHFKEVLYESGAEVVVSAGNRVNGVACTENPALLNGILRQRWHLNELIVASDCTWPVKNGPASIKAGLDIEMPFKSGGRVAAVETALEHGTLDWSNIQIMTERILKAQLRYHCRTIRMPSPDPEKIRCQRHIGLARRSVAESMVLLKNDNGFLPFNRTSQIKMTVLGELADRVSCAYQFDAASHAAGPPGTSPLEELRKRHNLAVDYMHGNETTKATRSAMLADVVLIFIRPSSKSELVHSRGRFLDRFRSRKQTGHAMARFRDRRHLTLDARDLELAKAALNVAGHKAVVIIEAGTSVTIPTFVRQKATAILFSSYGCRQYGKGLRDVLFDEQEPSGRLPFVLPDTEEQLLEKERSAASHEIKYDDKWGYRRLRHERQKPAYPFGYGLGYSSFALNSLWCSHPIVKISFDMTVNTTNTGTRSSAVVIQIYASRRSRRDSATPSVPPRSLIGFAKEVINPGESSEIAIICRLSPLAEFHSSTSKMVVAEGEYDLFVCQYEGDSKALSSSFQILNEVYC